MTNLNENNIELCTIMELNTLGWSYIHRSEITFDGKSPEYKTFGHVILRSRLRNVIAKNNPNIPFESQQEALKVVQRIASLELIIYTIRRLTKPLLKVFQLNTGRKVVT